MRLLALLILLQIGHIGLAQEIIIGVVTDSMGNTISGVNVYSLPDSTGAVTDNRGRFTLTFGTNEQTDMVLSHVRFESLTLPIAELTNRQDFKVVMTVKSRLLDEVSVIAEETALDINAVRIGERTIQMTPVPFNDISKILSLLPSVQSNNELSTAYSVRGGNYDENLVLVEGIEVYRPFLIRAGRQEGLSFINPDLITGVDFSAGGWEPAYGDKMSSVLNTTYKNPDELHGSVMLSLLGGSAHIEGSMEEGRISYLAGVRHKRSAYLLNTLDVKGSYNPRFTDAQSFWNFKLSDNSSLNLLLAYAGNRYAVEPEASETSFGTFSQTLRLNVAFEGSEQMNFNNYQTALKFNQRWSDNWTMSFQASISLANEREYVDLEGGYRLCDVDKNLDSDTFDQCVSIRGIGTLYSYARNKLDANILDINVSTNYTINQSNTLSGGLGYSNQLINDVLNEYDFIDSAGYVTIGEVIQAENNTNSNLIKGFVQHNMSLSRLFLNYGIRFNYNSLNGDLILSPRIQMDIQPGNQSPIAVRIGTGLYQQQPFYREYRNLQGEVNENVKAQSAFHFITGMDYTFNWWDRPFTLTVEAYYKYLWNQVPYTIDNLRIQYFPEYTATGYAAGFEARLGGEFIPGTESWFSFGVLSTREQVPGVDQGMVRRPTDQRFNMAILFEDHIPNDPSFRVNVSFNYGSGLPFGPPDDLTKRNSFTGDDYLRLDLGFSKIISFKDKTIEKLRIGIAVNNLLNANNAVTYTWVKDIHSNKFAVPNYLTGRLFNLIVKLKF